MVRPNQTRPRPLPLLNFQASCPATCRASNASLGALVPRARAAGGAAGVAAEGNADICEVARDGGRVALAVAGPEETRRAAAAEEAAAAG